MTPSFLSQKRPAFFKDFSRRSKGHAVFLACVLLGVSCFFEEDAEAAPIRLTGRGTYSRAGVHAYFNSVPMTGRFRNRGAGRYWRNGFYRSGRMTHIARSNFDFSGSLSYELWGMIFFRGTRGYIMRTRGYRPLARGWGYPQPFGRGPLRRFNRYLWPTIGAAEWTPGFGWVFRSRQNFRRSDLL